MLNRKTIILGSVIAVLFVFWFVQQIMKNNSRECVNDILYSLEVIADNDDSKMIVITDTSIAGLTPEKKQFNFGSLEPVVSGGQVDKWILRVSQGVILNFRPKAEAICISPTVQDVVMQTEKHIKTTVNGKKYPTEFSGTIEYAGDKVDMLIFAFSWKGSYLSQERVEIHWNEPDVM